MSPLPCVMQIGHSATVQWVIVWLVSLWRDVALIGWLRKISILAGARCFSIGVFTMLAGWLVSLQRPVERVARSDASLISGTRRAWQSGGGSGWAHWHFTLVLWLAARIFVIVSDFRPFARISVLLRLHCWCILWVGFLFVGSCLLSADRGTSPCVRIMLARSSSRLQFLAGRITLEAKWFSALSNQRFHMPTLASQTVFVIVSWRRVFAWSGLALRFACRGETPGVGIREVRQLCAVIVSAGFNL